MLTRAVQRNEFVLLPYGFTVRFESGEDGFIVASCAQLPGCMSQGRTLPEAVENIRDAILGYITDDDDNAPPAVAAYTSTCEAFTPIRPAAEDSTTSPESVFRVEYASAG